MISLRIFVHDSKGNKRMYEASEAEANSNVYLHRGHIPYEDIAGKLLTPVSFNSDSHTSKFGKTRKVTSTMYSSSNNTTYIYTE